MDFLKDKNILIISPESWGISFLSKHHYALLLAELGNRVWFLNAPHNPRFELPNHIVDQTSGRLHLLDDSTPKGMRFLPKFLQKRLMRTSYKNMERAAGVKFNVVWSFDNSRLYYFDCFEAYSIHHVVDLHMDYHLRKASSSSDLCLGVTTEIVARLKRFNDNAHLIRHGWRQSKELSNILTIKTDRLRAVYLGNLMMHAFDAQLMFQLATENPECDFILIGSEVENHLTRNIDAERLSILAELKNLLNVQFMGERSYEEAFSIINSCDIMLMMYFNFDRPFDNSSKLMSYLATGKVVVSNTVQEYIDTDLLCTAKSKKDFKILFKMVTANLDEWNSHEKSEQRKRYVETYSYLNLISEIDRLIYQK